MSFDGGEHVVLAAGGIDQAEMSAFKVLHERVRRAGLLRERPGYYVVKLTTVVASFAGGWVLFAVAGDSWWQLAVAVYIGFWCVQIGLVGHDAGHAQVCHGRRVGQFVNFLLQNLLLGISAGWWVGYHNRHHSHPNHLTKDPQVAGRPIVFALDETNMRVAWLRRFVIGHQAGLFFPMFLFYAAGMHAASLVELCRRRIARVVTELTLIGVHFVAYAGAVVLVLPADKALCFVVVQHIVIGLYLGAIFAPNHRGMPMTAGEEPEWLRRQVVTARNLHSTPLTHFLFGGLNYHIEHHLFPTMPRPHLRRARPIVKEFCRDVGLPYHEVTILQAYGEILRQLVDVSRAWRLRYVASRGV